jgi:MFS transporter, ACS family, D-galactonate transporter
LRLLQLRASEDLFAALLLFGVGEAPTFQANTKAIGYWFPAKERSFATSIFDAASRFSCAIGVPLLGVLLLRAGWRWSFTVTGLISLMHFGVFWRAYRNPKDDPKLTDVERASIGGNAPSLMSSRIR